MFPTDPDENFARELMQLFTIGLVKLNPDGTLIKDGTGDAEKTYSSQDIGKASVVLAPYQYN